MATGVAPLSRSAVCPCCGIPLEAAYIGLAQRSGHHYRRCSACGFLSRDHDEREELERYRGGYQESVAGRGREQSRRSLYERLLDQLGPPRGRLLDVGCGDGLFLALARARGWEAWGLEPAPALADRLERELGAPVIVGRIEDAELAPASFAVVILINVLDQVPDPLAALRRCESVLAPGGRLCARLPNGGFHRPLMAIAASGPASVAALASRLTPCHLHVFSPAHALRLATAAGFAGARVQEAGLSTGRPEGDFSPLAGSLVVAAKAVVTLAGRALAALTARRLLVTPSIELWARKAGP